MVVWKGCFAQTLYAQQRCPYLRSKVFIQMNAHTNANNLDNLLSDNIPITCSRCGSFVKPNITFFGEPLDENTNARIVEVSFD